MTELLKKLSLDDKRSAGVSEVVAMVKEGGIGALKVRSSSSLPAQSATIIPLLHRHYPQPLAAMVLHRIDLVPHLTFGGPQLAV